LQRLAGCIDRGLEAVAAEQAVIREHVQELHKMQRTLDPQRGSAKRRRRRFRRLQQRLSRSTDPVRVQMATVMAAFVVGLFAGGDGPGLPEDNLDLERWFRLPKGHERRIHGHKHAGVRIVQEGATLVLVLDAHRSHPEPFRRQDLERYRGARRPPEEEAALERRKVMRRARSTKQRPQLLADLERRYRDSP
jgi:hypothetical protein